MTPAELFHRAGVALFGELYVAPLANALKVDKNTVGKWAAGKSEVPAGVWDELSIASLDRIIELRRVGDLLERQTKKARPPREG